MPFQKTCAGCSVPFIASKQSRRFHSRSCYAQWRETTPEWQAAKRRGQAKSARTMHQKSLEIYTAKVQAAPSKGAAFRDGRREGYRLGWKRGHRVGYAEGYEQCAREMHVFKVAS